MMKRAVLALTLVLWSTAALSSSSYPSAMKTHLSSTATPSCTACHASNAGGFGTLTKPFGTTIVAAGLGAGDVNGVNDALDTVEAAGTDSDGDGIGDIDELRAGADPNDGSDGGAVPVDGAPSDALRYGFGCGAGGVPLVFALLVLARRRRSVARPVTAVRWHS